LFLVSFLSKETKKGNNPLRPQRLERSRRRAGGEQKGEKTMNQNEVVVKRWPPDKQPEESVIRKTLSAESLSPYQWSNAPGDVYGAHDHAYHKVIYVLQGSITFGLPDKG
jgi:quercetin dioxygenase-like cupin family protein